MCINITYYNSYTSTQVYLKYSWYDALQKCVNKNMSLATIDTKVKSDDINKLVRESFGTFVRLWIGGAAVGEYTDGFIWISTGKQLSFTHWSTGNPDFSASNEYCIQIGWGGDMEWNDQNCRGKFGFICEYNQHYQKHQELQNELQKQEHVQNELKEDLQIESQNRLQLQEELKQEKQKKQQLQQEHNQQQKNVQLEKQMHEDLKQELPIQKQQQEELKQELQRQQTIQQSLLSQMEMLKQQQSLLQLLEKQQELRQKISEQLQQLNQWQEAYNRNGVNGKYHDIILNIGKY